MNFRALPSFSFAILLIAVPEHARAWGSEGHEIVALIAAQELSPAARSQVALLLGSEAMLVHDASWADEIRDQRPDTGPWHYVDIPLTASAYDSRRDCPNEDCVVAQIGRDLRILKDTRAGDDARREALRFLIHFAADIHQPLHAEDDDDKGGNQVRTLIGHERSNLHRVWDLDVVRALGDNPEAIADGIARDLTPAQRRDWSSGTPARWANESHAIAREHVYPPLGGSRAIRLPRDYAAREAPLARILLAKAGMRLAWLLNAAFS